MPRGASVIEYHGKRGVVYRVKYIDADGKQVQETVGAERDGVTRKHAEAELRERLALLGYEGELGDALFRWAGNENLEERVDGAESIDPVVLEELRSR